MFSKDRQLYSSVENNEVYKVKVSLAERDTFDINWKNPDKVSVSMSLINIL